MLAAIAATVGHWLLVFDGSDRNAATVRAGDFTVPAVRLEILPCGFLIREALEELIEANGFRFLRHETYLAKFGWIVKRSLAS